MNKLLFIFFIVFIVSFNLYGKENKLELIKVYDVLTKNDIEPSGLTLWDGEFYTVSDKHNKIYHLSFEHNKVILNPFIDIEFMGEKDLDFEGITHDDKYFYLVSEKLFQILKISKDGKFQQAVPLTDNIRETGNKVGLFQTRNAYLEGICALGKNKFLLVVERQPRGFIEYDAITNTIKAYQKNQAIFSYPKGRPADFTGLSCSDGMYVLDRNAYMVAELNKINGEFSETKGYSYAHIVNQDQLKYKDMQFGHAEGLVVKGNKIYIILDNNKDLHSDSNSNNSLFIEMKINH